MKRYGILYLDETNCLNCCETHVKPGGLEEENAVILEIARSRKWRWFKLIELPE